jgi:CelD/BcsL family acetyltransferase involved in cellulose biosynthesis
MLHDTRSRVIRDLHDLEHLAKDWHALSGSARIPMQEYIWVRACAASFSPREHLHVVTVVRDGVVSAIAPLITRGRNPLRLTLPGLDRLFEPMDFVFADDEALAVLADALARYRLPLHLARLPTGSPAVETLRRRCRRNAIVIVRPASPCPRIPLGARWTHPEDCLTASRRSLLRRMRRRAEKLGIVSYDVVTPTSETLDSVLAEAFRLEAAGWKSRQGTALNTDPELGAFFRVFAASACEQGILRLCFLRIGNRAVAMLYAVEYKGALWALKIGYDEEFAHCSPGTLLINEAVRRAAHQGLGSFEFLGTVEDWTRVWTNNELECVSLRTYPLGVHGAIALGTDAARAMVARLRRIFGRKAVRR